MTEPNPTPDTPSLAGSLTKLAEQWNDAQGQMMWGAQWPTVKAAQAEQRRQAKAEAERQARLDRWADRARVALVVYLVAALVLMAAAGVVWAWRVAL